MADADEDLIPRSFPDTNSIHDPSIDLEDETQDFRFLASLTKAPNTGGNDASTKSSGALPKRGEKDFQPNSTNVQASALEASRAAMRDVLAVERVHIPRDPLVGQYLPDEQDWRYDGTTDFTGPGGRCVVVERFKTTYSRNIGLSDWRNWTWLLPEEALFLLERGTLDIRYPSAQVEQFSKAERDGSSDEDDDEASTSDKDESEGKSLDVKDRDTSSTIEEGTRKIRPRREIPPLRVGDIPMSLQGAYSSLLGQSGLTHERYIVYTHLRRLGYILQRAPTWFDGEAHQDGRVIEAPPPPFQLAAARPTSPATSLINRLVAYVFSTKPGPYCPSTGPLLRPGVYRNYNDMFRALSLIPHQSIDRSPLSSNFDRASKHPQAPFRIAFNVWKASSAYRKSAPGPPDFRIAVIDARETSVPTLDEISALLDSMPDDSLPKDKRMEMKLKHGRRNCILAVVDSGLVSYLRTSDSGFGDVGKLFEEKTARGTKGGRARGGGGRSRGGGQVRGDRGRGRGRGG